MYIQITVSDTKTGRIIRKTRKKLSRSFVIQFLQFIESMSTTAYGVAGTAITITDTGNTGRSMSAASAGVSSYWAIGAVANDDTYGVVVGSDNTAETNSDYVLGTQIAEGAGAGQLNHGAPNVTTTGVVGANVDMVYQRPFINNSGGAVTIEEAGIYLKTTPGWFFCLVRDTTGTVTVNNGQTATVSYTFRTTV